MGGEKRKHARILDWNIQEQHTQSGTSGKQARDWNIR